MSKIFLSILLCFLLTGCAGLFQNRTFIDEMEHDTDGIFVAGRDFPLSSGDSGNAFRNEREIKSRTPASAKSKEYGIFKNSLEKELVVKESALSNVEYRDYVKKRKWLGSISEKIYYLDLPKSERARYLRNIGYTNASKKVKRRRAYRSKIKRRKSGASWMAGYFDNQDLYQGMNKEAVIRNWGQPSRVEVAGNPRNQNERWAFQRHGKTRYVYFEAGQVEGWFFE